MLNLLNILVIVVYLVLVYKYHKNTTLLLLFTLATILILCNLNKITEVKEGLWIESNAPVDFDTDDDVVVVCPQGLVYIIYIYGILIYIYICLDITSIPSIPYCSTIRAQRSML